MWQADVEYLEPSQVRDTTMENGFTGASFTYRMPLYTGKDWLSADGGKPFFAVLAQASASVRQSQLDFLEPDRLLSLGRIGFTGLMAKGLRNLFMLNIAASLPSESFRFKATHLRPQGSLVWRKLYHNNTFWHTLGILYSPITGRDLPLPILGFGLKLGNDDQLQFTFPFNFSYTHVFSKKFSLIGRVQNMGGYHYLKADSVYREEPLVYRFRYPRLGILARYYTSRHVVITPEIALTGRGRLVLDDYKTYQTNSLFFRISLQVRFGNRPAAAPIMNFDPGDSGYDPAYLVE
ncbi:MAG: hypothetical protein JNL88_03670 [Bacteroidia bacterium]|nr:hypothetical protein [Bacteroidia bacterium]